MSTPLYSMTGYGRAEAPCNGVRLVVEIRSWNGRYLDLKFRLARELSSLEPELRKRIQERLSRGRVEVSVEVIPEPEEQQQLNVPLVKNYLSLAETIRELGGEGSLSVSSILTLPGILLAREVDLSSPQAVGQIQQAVEQALQAVTEARRSEGEALRQELEQRLGNVERLLGPIGEQARGIRDYYRQKLQDRIAELERTGLEENRLAQELLFYAERCDVSEELARLESHLQRFRRYLEVPSQGGVGRQLDFLCQELNRELHTILSKSPFPALSELAVEARVEVEKIREQVQNVE